MGLKNKHKPESEKTFEYIFESITDGVSLVDAETKKISLGNRSMCNMLGYTRDEIRNITIYDIHPVEALPLVDELFNQLLNRRIELVREIPVLAKDGKLFYADITASPVVYKNRPHLTATFRNVTERREVEKQKDAAVEAMSKSEARLNAFIDRAAIAIAISKDQMLTFVNPAFMRMFGYEHESELIGRSIYDIITISEHSKVKAVEKASVDKTQIIHELETVVKRKDGTEIWIHAAISDVYDYGSLGFITDITDQIGRAHV